MRPNDDNGRLPLEVRPFRVLVIAGSQRRQYDCPAADSKARTLMFRMVDQLPQAWEVDFEDLGNVWNREQIRSCNGCVSSSAALCVWPCNCYEKHSRHMPDLMWNLDMYARLDLADAWAIIGPVNWYAPSSNLKAMFDRLVCANGGNPREDLIGHKDPEKAIGLEHSDEWEELSQNHLEGRTAAFFCYGDGGADELGEDGIPRILKHKDWFDSEQEPFEDMRDAYQQLVWQCRYSGIEVPDRLWRYSEFGRDRMYSENQAEHMVHERSVMETFDGWTEAFISHVEKKGKVRPAAYRAYGYKPPSHLIADIKTKLRGLRMLLGIPIPGSSPEIQQGLGLNRDTRLNYKEGEGERLRSGK